MTSDRMGRIADRLGYAGSYAAARDLFQLIAGAYSEDEDYGAEHLDTLNACQQLAFWTAVAGDAASARDQFAALLPVRERVSGPEHPATLAARAGLAFWTAQAAHPAPPPHHFAPPLPPLPPSPA